MRVARPGARFAISVNAAHWAEARFAEALGALTLTAVHRDDVPIYAQPDHAGDRAYILTFVKP